MTQKRQNDEFEIAEMNRRLKLLLLADKINSVTEACKQTGFSRTQYYLFKKRYDEKGLQGLAYQYLTQSEHPNSFSSEIRNMVRQASIENPAKGAAQISGILKINGVSIGTASTHKLLTEFALSTRKARWIFLENYLIQENVKLTDLQWDFVREMNPCHLEKGNIGKKPGDRLVQDVQIVPGQSSMKCYIHFILDTYSNYAFAQVYTDLSPSTAIELLRNQVIPYYDNMNLKIQKICTHNGRTYSGNKYHDYSVILNHEKIEHEIRAKGKTHGFSSRFQEILEQEFISEVRKTPFKLDPIGKLNEMLTEWITYYNEKRGHFGYPNYGKIPVEYIK